MSTALAELIQSRITAEREARFGTLCLPPDFVVPNYGGRSIVNVPASIAGILGGPLHAAPLDREILDGLTGGVRRIVLVILDALGYERTVEVLAESPDNGLHALFNLGGRMTPLTSVFPSSTTAALTALWSGYTPAEH